MCKGVSFKVNTSGPYDNSVSGDFIVAEHHKPRASGRTDSPIAERRIRNGEPVYIQVDGVVHGEYERESIGRTHDTYRKVLTFLEPVAIGGQRNLYLNGKTMQKLNAASSAARNQRR
jgi:hypothetical protein